jgi:hypothetical protein
VGKKIMVVETKDGIFLKPLPSPKEEFGSLRNVFKSQTSKELIDQARAQERENEKRRNKSILSRPLDG